jgi:hypothetical protein
LALFGNLLVSLTDAVGREKSSKDAFGTLTSPLFLDFILREGIFVAFLFGLVAKRGAVVDEATNRIAGSSWRSGEIARS